MKKEEIFFLSRDGKTKIHAVKWIPEGKPVCILQIVHGMAEYIERYERLASVLTRQGILVTGQYGRVDDAVRIIDPRQE